MYEDGSIMCVNCVWGLCDGITFVDKLISNVLDKGNIVINSRMLVTFLARF